MMALTSYIQDRRAIFYNDVANSLVDYRLYFIIIQSAARSLRASQTMRSPSFLTFVAFIWKLLDTSHGSHEFCFLLFMFAYFQHILHLLLPLPPSLSVLFPTSATFPLSVILFNLLVDVVGLVILFFLPIFVALLLILARYFRIPFFVLTSTFASPDEAWMAIFYIFCALWLIMLLFIFYLSIISAVSPSSTAVHMGPPLPWDAYGPRVSSSTRWWFFTCVRHYSVPHFFPAPFNLLEIAFVYLPSLLLRLCRQVHWASWLQEWVKPQLWRFTALPLGLIFAGTWGWRRA